MKQAVLISTQFLVELPEHINYTEATDFGCEWLSNLGTDALDYRHPKIAGIYLRPVPVQIIDMDKEEILTDDNLIQL